MISDAKEGITTRNIKSWTQEQQSDRTEGQKKNEEKYYPAWTVSKENPVDWWKKERRGRKRNEASPKKTDLGILESQGVMGKDFKKRLKKKKKRLTVKGMKTMSREWKQYVRQSVKNKTGRGLEETGELLTSRYRYTDNINNNSVSKAQAIKHSFTRI